MSAEPDYRYRLEEPPRITLSRMVCVDCGAVVMDTAAHDRFHDRLDRADTAIVRLGGRP